MNIRKRLEHLATLSGKERNTGRTTRTCEAALETNGVVIAANFEQAKYLQRKYPGLVVKSMEVNLEGFMGPFLFDHYAIETLLLKAAKKIEELEKENSALRQGLDYYQHGPSLKENQNDLPEGD